MLSHLLLAIGLSASVGISSLRVVYPNHQSGSALYPTTSMSQFSTPDSERVSWYADDYNNLTYSYDGTTLMCNYANDYQSFEYGDFPYGNLNAQFLSQERARLFFVARDSSKTLGMPSIVYQPNVSLSYSTEGYDYIMALFGRDDSGDVDKITFVATSYFAIGCSTHIYLQLGDIPLVYEPNWSLFEGVYVATTGRWAPLIDDNGLYSITMVCSNHNNDSGAYQTGYDTGYDTGFNTGYSEGFTAGHTANYSFFTLMSAIADTPLLMLRSLFNFELFGINVLVVVLSLITGLMVFYLIRKFL